MKAILFLLAFALVAAPIYAGNGDFYVNGNLGVGTTTPGCKLDVTGAARISGNLGIGATPGAASGIAVVETVTAVGGQGQGVMLPAGLNLTAAANNDVLAGIRISPTFTPGTYTGVKTYGVYSVTPANNYFAGKVGIGTAVPNTGLDVEAAPVVNGADRAVLTLGDTTAMAADVGGGLQFAGKFTSSGGGAEWGGIKSGKANGTDGDYGAYMAFMTRTNGSGTAERMRIDSLGRVGIGTTSPLSALHVSGPGDQEILVTSSTPTTSSWSIGTGFIYSGGGARDFFIWDYVRNAPGLVINPSGYVGIGVGTGVIYYALQVNGSAYATSFISPSDVRHKDSIQSLAISGLDTVAKLRPVSFVWKEPKDDGMKGEQIGFIAQEVEQVLPQLVLTQQNEEGTKGLKYNEMISILTKAIQEQQAQIEDLKGEVAALKAAR